MSALPSNLPILHDADDSEDALRVLIVRQNMMLMGEGWTRARPVDVATLPRRRTNGVYEPLAGVRIDHLMVTLERHDEDGRMLCVIPDKGAPQRLILPPEAHPMREHPDPWIELNALMRLWGRIPDRLVPWSPDSGSDPWSAAGRRMIGMLGAVASVEGSAGQDRRITVTLPSPWAPAGAACFGDLRDVLLWRDDVLRTVAEKVGAPTCASLEVLHRNEGTEAGSWVSSVPTAYFTLRAASLRTPMAQVDSIETLRILSDLGSMREGPMTASFHARDLGSDPRFVEPVIVGSWRS